MSYIQPGAGVFPGPHNKNPPLSSFRPLVEISNNSNKWTCKICTYLNPPDAVKCEMCGTPRYNNIAPELSTTIPTSTPGVINKVKAFYDSLSTGQKTALAGLGAAGLGAAAYFARKKRGGKKTKRKNMRYKKITRK